MDSMRAKRGAAGRFQAKPEREEPSMNRIIAVCVFILLSACGVTETASVAATGAAAKAQEAKEAERTKRQMQERLDQVNQQALERAKLAAE